MSYPQAFYPESPYLERVGAFVPESTMSVKELSGSLDLTSTQQRFFTRFLGLDRVAVATGLGLADMLTSAAEDALTGVDRDSVRFLVHAHTMQHVSVSEPKILDDVRQRLGLRNASVFSLSHMNCVVGLYALQIARFLLAGAAPEDRVLVVTGDKVLTHQARLIPDITIQGDGAAACLVGQDSRGDRVLGRAFTVLGRFYQGIDCSPPLQLEYKQIYVESLSRVMTEALENAGRDAMDISLILPHNVNQLSWKRISELIGIPRDRVYLENVAKFGHCYSSDPFINLAVARKQGLVKSGDLVLMATAGLGASFAATVVEIGKGRES